MFLLGIFYILLINEFNRVGFVNRKMIILTIISLLFTSFIAGISHYLIFLTSGIMFATCTLHIPYRSKVKKLFKQIDLDQSINIYNNRMVQNNRITEFGFEIRQSEIDWLTKQILFSSRKLKEVQWVYMDNELIGNNFHVNIV